MKKMTLLLTMLMSIAVAAMELNPKFTPEAIARYKAKADSGDVESQYLYSRALANGVGVEKNEPLAMEYAIKAASQNFPQAFRLVGAGYTEGWGVASNGVAASRWFGKFVQWARPAAENGDAHAQWGLALCYYYGDGVAKNYEKAAKWYRMAAERGHAEAQRRLGVCYHRGEGVEKDHEEAIKWDRKAAEQGDAKAQFNLGWSYYRGDGVVASYEEAAKWYRKAADQGDLKAVVRLGECYLAGQGVERNDKEAVRLFRQAAERAERSAMVRLGTCYHFGRGVTKDVKEAVKWYRKGAELGDVNAMNNLYIALYNSGRCSEDEKMEALNWRKKAEQISHGLPIKGSNPSSGEDSKSLNKFGKVAGEQCNYQEGFNLTTIWGFEFGKVYSGSSEVGLPKSYFLFDRAHLVTTQKGRLCLISLDAEVKNASLSSLSNEARKIVADFEMKYKLLFKGKPKQLIHVEGIPRQTPNMGLARRRSSRAQSQWNDYVFRNDLVEIRVESCCIPQSRKGEIHLSIIKLDVAQEDGETAESCRAKLKKLREEAKVEEERQRRVAEGEERREQLLKIREELKRVKEANMDVVQ